MHSPDPADRIAAIKQAVDRKDSRALPALVERLEDEDEAVRFYAILALEKMTGTRLGYEYWADSAERAAAVNRWRRRLESERSSMAESQAVGTPEGLSVSVSARDTGSGTAPAHGQ